METFQQNFRTAVEKIFNNWTGLRLAVEHGMGGRNGQKTAIEVMNYMYEHCIGNARISQHDISDTLEEIMDQEFHTILEDGSATEISALLLRYLEMCKEGKYTEIQQELSLMPRGREWLTPTAKITYVQDSDFSSSEDDSDSDCPMDVDTEDAGVSNEAKASNVEECDPGWTVVRTRRKK